MSCYTLGSLIRLLISIAAALRSKHRHTQHDIRNSLVRVKIGDSYVMLYPWVLNSASN
jgi:hypothetical protein